MTRRVPGRLLAALLLAAAAGVDAVLRSQVERYQRYVDTGKP